MITAGRSEATARRAINRKAVNRKASIPAASSRRGRRMAVISR